MWEYEEICGKYDEICGKYVGIWKNMRKIWRNMWEICGKYEEIICRKIPRFSRGWNLKNSELSPSIFLHISLIFHRNSFIFLHFFFIFPSPSDYKVGQSLYIQGKHGICPSPKAYIEGENSEFFEYSVIFSTYFLPKSPLMGRGELYSRISNSGPTFEKIGGGGLRKDMKHVKIPSSTPGVNMRFVRPSLPWNLSPFYHPPFGPKFWRSIKEMWRSYERDMMDEEIWPWIYQCEVRIVGRGVGLRII